MELAPGVEFINNGQRYVIIEIDHVPAYGEYADCFTVYADTLPVDHVN